MSRRVSEDKEVVLAKTLFIIICSYTICVIPMAVTNVIDYRELEPDLQVLAYCMYYPIYCINNFVYALRHRQYQSAYVALFERSVICI
jgi:membrane protein CcdC involved in cytochrome C biogenesis